jgi:lysophospholipase L1-like esterase
MSYRFVLILTGAAMCYGQNAAAPNPAYRKIEDAPGLPRVLLIGDSISIGYTEPVRTELAGKANVHRIPTNGSSTALGVQNLDAWLGTAKWDVIHFNFGLHDLKIMEGGQHQVPLADYESNLRTIVERCKKTGARLIWAATTPVPDAKTNPPRAGADVIVFNTVAKKIMDESGIPIDDLFTLVKPRLEELQLPANVHFNKDGYGVLAQQAAQSILKALESR